MYVKVESDNCEVCTFQPMEKNATISTGTSLFNNLMFHLWLNYSIENERYFFSIKFRRLWLIILSNQMFTLNATCTNTVSSPPNYKQIEKVLTFCAIWFVFHFICYSLVIVNVAARKWCNLLYFVIAINPPNDTIDYWYWSKN